MRKTQLIEAMRAQEQTLVLPKFSQADAWQVGQALYTKSVEREMPLFMEIFVNGGVRFSAATPKAHNNLAEWVRRKRNLTLRMGQSSYITRLTFEEWGASLESFGMNSAEYGLGGGSFPIIIADVGIIGAISTSGVSDIIEHDLVVECISEHFGREFNPLQQSH